MFRECSVGFLKVQERFRESSGNTQRRFREDSGNIHVIFRKGSRNFPESFLNLTTEQLTRT